MTMNMYSAFRLPMLGACVAAAALAAGCDRGPTQTAASTTPTTSTTIGQKVDRAIEKTADKTKDLGTTAAISAALARDPALSALKIDVDTSAGRVSLRGQAPDSEAVERATAIARGTDGVVSVDNQLKIVPRS